MSVDGWRYGSGRRVRGGLRRGRGTTGGPHSGLVVTAAGHPVLTSTGGVLTLAILPMVAITITAYCQAFITPRFDIGAYVFNVSLIF
ncbi:hypothetical protein [Streptomyces sp. NPDC086777]|uniref:hypothetical protein n=1 Tax=Streptomyces sp. NPDC086777 TaxID=3154866 RepID=UPI00344D1AA2